MRIIFLFSDLITERDYYRYGCFFLQENGYEVEVWLVNPQSYIMSKELEINYYRADNTRYYNEKTVGDAIKRDRNSIFVIVTAYDRYYVVRYLCKYHCRSIAYLSVGGRVHFEYDNNSVESETRLERYNRIYREDGFLKTVRYAVKTFSDMLLCEKEKKENVRIGYYYKSKFLKYCIDSVRPSLLKKFGLNDNKVIYLHCGDYDRYLENNQRKRKEDGEYIVYIDSNFGGRDYDTIAFGWEDPWIHESTCIKRKICKVFDALEDHYRLKVVIAGHPHGDYSEIDFGGRDIFFNKTAELVSGAKFVIMQWSAAISFVILYDKPLMILMNESLKKHPLYSKMLEPNWTKFSLKLCNMDDDQSIQTPWKYVNIIENDKKEWYKNTYIKERNTPDMLSYKVLEKCICSMEG